MDKKYEVDYLSDLIKKRSFLYLMLGFAFLMGFVVWGYVAWNSVAEQSKLPRVELSGTYKNEKDGNPISFHGVQEIDCGTQKYLWLDGTLEHDIPAGEEVFLYLHRASINVWINNQLVLQDDSSWNQKWISFSSHGLKKGDHILLELQGIEGRDVEKSMKQTLMRLCYGTKYQLLRQQTFSNMGKMVICLIIIVLGIAELFTAFILILMKAADIRGSVSCGILLITGALCCVIDYEYINLFIANERSLYLLDLTVQLSTALFFLVNMMFHMHSYQKWKISNRLILGWIVILLVYLGGYHFQLMPITEEGWMSIIAFFVALFILIDFIMLYLDYKEYPEEQLKLVIASSAILTISIIVELFYFVCYFSYWFYPFEIGLVIYAILQYTVLYKQAERREKLSRRATELEAELVESQVAITLSQIQPHFLYNSLTAIQTLCMQDPEKARVSLGDFAKYLRGNMDSLNSKELIPFSKELEHTRHYVQLERMRYGEYLEIEYFIDDEDFSIPALTLQPLVENAIKHGIGAKEEGGSVLISVYREDDSVILRVEDDGVGFDMDKNESNDAERSHVGLKNVAQRIEKMAGGKLVIESSVGEGTIATIILPQGE